MPFKRITSRAARGIGFGAVGILYLLLTVNALTCSLSHAAPPEGGASCAHTATTAASEHGAGHHSQTSKHTSHHGTAQSLCKCLDNLTASGVPTAVFSGTYLVSVQRVTPAETAAPHTGWRQTRLARGPPFITA
ncbi:MAG: hypothetical protein ACE5FN_07285 [Leptospirillia bacterium]